MKKLVEKMSEVKYWGSSIKRVLMCPHLPYGHIPDLFFISIDSELLKC